MDEFFPFDVNHYLLVDTIEGMESDLNENMIKVYYDDETQTVSEQYKSALNMIETKYIIHDMEDFVLLDKPQEDKLLDCIDFLEKTDYDFVRLIKCGVREVSKSVGDNLYEIDSSDPYSYSHATTIWKKDSFLKVHNFMIDYKEEKGIKAKKFQGEGREGNTKKMLDINMEGFINDMCKENDLVRGAYYYQKEQRVPRTNHYYSNIFPFIMTAIKGSMWNFESYSNEILALFEKYDIKDLKRGLLK